MKLHSLTWGDSASTKTAVLIHGVTSNAQSWIRVGPRLAAQGYYVVAPDLRGHGDSPKRDGEYALDLMVSDLPDTIPTTPTLLIGHSFGGVMAILAATQGHLAPKYLVLEDPVLHFADQALPASLLKNDEANLPRDVEGVMQANPKWARVDAEGKIASLQAIDWDHMRQVFSENAPWDLRRTVIDVAQTIPTLLILPETSFYVPEEDAAIIRRELGASAVVKIPETDHSIHRDDIARFLETIQSWMAGKSLGQGLSNANNHI